jgi:hypothetical protein
MVLEGLVVLFELVEAGEELGNVKVLGLFHEELRSLFPLAFQELFKGLGL